MSSLNVSHPRYIGGTGAQPDSRTLEPMILEPAGSNRRHSNRRDNRPAGCGGDCRRPAHRTSQTRSAGGWGDAMTDEQGRFVINGLEPGVYNLLFIRGRGAAAQATARAVEGLRVRAGADTPVDLTLIEGRALHGVVIDQETDRPMAGTLVGCYGPARPQSGAAVQNCQLPTKRDASRSTFLPASNTSTSWMSARSAV